MPVNEQSECVQAWFVRVIFEGCLIYRNGVNRVLINVGM